MRDNKKIVGIKEIVSWRYDTMKLNNLLKLKKNILILAIFSFLLLAGCTRYSIRTNDRQPLPVTFIKPGAKIAILPFETESALSNLGTQVSDELTAFLLENTNNIKIVSPPNVQRFLVNSNIISSGIPDMHTLHSIKEGLKCDYVLTGNLYTSIGDVRYSATFTNRIASGSVTVRLIECDSAKVVWAKHFQDNYQTTNYYSQTGNPTITYLTDGQLQEQLIHRLAEDIAQYFYKSE